MRDDGRMRLWRSLALGTALLLGGCAGQAAGEASGWYADRKAVPPRANRVVICHGFGCEYRTPVSFAPADLKKLGAILRAGQASPAAERAAIARAVQWQERRVAPVVGSGGDVGGFDAANSGVRGQMDCIDEATNTTSLLLVAQRNGLLKHHTVRSAVARGFFLDGRYPHATAVVAEKGAGKAWAIDSWPGDNGVAPDVLPLDTWFAQSPGRS